MKVVSICNAKSLRNEKVEEIKIVSSGITMDDMRKQYQKYYMELATKKIQNK